MKTLSNLILVALVGVGLVGCGSNPVRMEDELADLRAREAAIEAKLAAQKGGTEDAPVVAKAQDPVVVSGMSPEEYARLEWYKGCMKELMKTAAEGGRAVLPGHTATACGYGAAFVGYEHQRGQDDARLAVELKERLEESSPTVPVIGQSRPTVSFPLNLDTVLTSQ